MTSTATFSDIDDMARFCAGLTRERITYTIAATNTVGYYVVTIEFEVAGDVLR